MDFCTANFWTSNPLKKNIAQLQTSHQLCPSLTQFLQIFDPRVVRVDDIGDVHLDVPRRRVAVKGVHKVLVVEVLRFHFVMDPNPDPELTKG